MYYDISSALRRKEQQQWVLQIQAGQASGVDWAACLILQALHDKYGFGKRRFEVMNDRFEEKVGQFQGKYYDWLKELECNGFSTVAMDKFAEKLAKVITKNTKDRILRAKTMDMLKGTLITIFYTLRKEYGFGKKRIHDLQAYIADYAWLIYKREVSIFEFMECLTQECNIEFPVLEEYVKVNGRPKIYG